MPTLVKEGSASLSGACDGLLTALIGIRRATVNLRRSGSPIGEAGPLRHGCSGRPGCTIADWLSGGKVTIEEERQTHPRSNDDGHQSHQGKVQDESESVHAQTVRVEG